jgi:hypothetical protein
MHIRFVIFIIALNILVIKTEAQTSRLNDLMPTFLTFGAIDNTFQIQQRAARKMGFRYRLITIFCNGLVIRKDGTSFYLNVDSLHRHNDSVSLFLTKMIGPDWREKLHNEMDLIVSNEKKVTDLVVSSPSIVKKRKNFADEIDERTIWLKIEESKNSQKYLVNVYSSIDKNGDEKKVQIYRIIVYPNKGKIKILSDREIPIKNQYSN